MGSRVLLFLFIVSSCWCCNARDLTDVWRSNDKLSNGGAEYAKVVNGNEKFCSFCEQYAADALAFLSDNNTQTDIIGILHQSCSQIPPFKQECLSLVDHYVPLFFLEISSLQAEDLCQKVRLCEAVSAPRQLADNKCDLCHNAVSEALSKLKDPDTELEIVKMLLKVCNSVGKPVTKCKRLVFEYAPLILANAEQFLEKNDVCTELHACDGTEKSLRAAS